MIDAVEYGESYPVALINTKNIPWYQSILIFSFAKI